MKVGLKHYLNDIPSQKSLNHMQKLNSRLPSIFLRHTTPPQLCSPRTEQIPKEIGVTQEYIQTT